MSRSVYEEADSILCDMAERIMTAEAPVEIPDTFVEAVLDAEEAFDQARTGPAEPGKGSPMDLGFLAAAEKLVIAAALGRREAAGR